MASTTERLPFPLSERVAGQASVLLARNGREVDVAIGGVPFLLASEPGTPFTIRTIPSQKEQLDTELDPGEQSLGFWWRRSQDSWHEGAGSRYQESRADTNPNSGFWDSEGIDVWTKGEMKLLRRTVNHAAGTYSRVNTYLDGSTEKVSLVSSGALATIATVSGTITTLHNPATKTIVDGFISNGTFYDVASDGTLYEGLVSSPGTATSWPLTGGGSTRLAFGKHRLWVIGGRFIWQPNLASAGGTAQAAIFTNPNKGWTYTALAEGPQAMYFAGHDGRTSSIQAVALDTGGAVPTLTGAQVTAQMPDGELIQELSILAGQFVGIGTNKGFRVGVIDGTSITYGPLLFEGVTACTAITTMNRFFLVAFKTATGTVVYRVDTAADLGDGIFAYAKDVSFSGATSVTSLATYGATPQVLATTNAAYWYQHATELVSTGWLETGRVRYRTTEKKLFKHLDVEYQPLNGTLVASLYEDAGTTVAVGTFTIQGETASGPLAIDGNLGPQKHVSVKLDFTRSSTDATKGPVVQSYLLRALPATKPQRLLTIPVLCFDYEAARSGQRYGYQGWSQERLEAVQAMENTADTVSLQLYIENNPLGETVLIEGLEFTQGAAANTRHAPSGRGGILVLNLRTVAL